MCLLEHVEIVLVLTLHHVLPYFVHAIFFIASTGIKKNNQQPTSPQQQLHPLRPPWAAAVVTGAGGSPSTAPCARFQNRCSDEPPALPGRKSTRKKVMMVIQTPGGCFFLVGLGSREKKTVGCFSKT